jgi:predicted subunit of tRNA(5-methylaminomethyl-2-thiouridylate) methyltransferase
MAIAPEVFVVREGKSEMRKGQGYGVEKKESLSDSAKRSVVDFPKLNNSKVSSIQNTFR